MNRYIKVGNKYLGQIYGTKYDRYFWIDAEDFKEVCKYTWYYHPKRTNVGKDYGCIKTSSHRATNRVNNLSLHILIMGESPDETRPYRP